MNIKSIDLRDGSIRVPGAQVGTRRIMVGEGNVAAIRFEAGFYLVTTRTPPVQTIRVPVGAVLWDQPAEELPKGKPLTTGAKLQAKAAGIPEMPSPPTKSEREHVG